MTKAKSLIPDSLYWLLRWVIAKPEKEDDDDFSSLEYSNSSDERRILMLAQDVEHCATHARASMPKHVALGIAARNMTRSKQLITMLSRKGHCSSSDDVEEMDTSIANEIIAKSDIFGVVLPSNISTGVCVQVAGDNNDINEDTLDGKTPQYWYFFREVSSVLPLNRRSMHTKQRVNAQLNRWRQRRVEKTIRWGGEKLRAAPHPWQRETRKREVCANISDSTVHMESVQLILVSPEGHVMSGSNVPNDLHSEAWMDLAWALVNMTRMFWPSA